jgi:hypothetical protein
MKPNANPKTKSNKNKKNKKNAKTSEPGTMLVRTPTEAVHKFTRFCSKNISLSESTGWVATATDLEFTFSLQQVAVYLGGVFFANIAVPNYTELSALFNSFRIDSVEMTMYFSNNNSSVNSPATGLPLMNVVFDPTGTAACTLVQAQQYGNNKVVQLGNGADMPPKFMFKPLPSGAVYDTAILSGYGAQPSWINTTNPDVPHYGVKVVYDPASAGVTVIGQVQFYFKLNYSLRGID